uniref:Uncharacterized protein n=1 Tax=Romanomermis culicivorax TaxID=13658 RepID=A0A915JZM8_ROMCU
IHNAHQYLKPNDFLKDKHCFLQINNDDNLHFAGTLGIHVYCNLLAMIRMRNISTNDAKLYHRIQYNRDGTPPEKIN